MRAEEFAVKEPASPPSIQATDFTIDSHTNPSLARVTLCRAKTDLLGKGVEIYFGWTDTPICPVLGLLSYIAIHQAGTSSAPLLIHADGSPPHKGPVREDGKEDLAYRSSGVLRTQFLNWGSIHSGSSRSPSIFYKNFRAPREWSISPLH